jgi:hypothetical protein
MRGHGDRNGSLKLEMPRTDLTKSLLALGASPALTTRQRSMGSCTRSELFRGRAVERSSASYWAHRFVRARRVTQL